MADVLEARRRPWTERSDEGGDGRSNPRPGRRNHGGGEVDAASTARADNKGTLLLDATNAPGDVRSPTNTALLDHARRSLEQIVDAIWTCSREAGCAPASKPPTHRETARKSFAAFSRRRRPSCRAVHRERRAQLQYVERDLGHVKALLDGLLANDAQEGALTCAQYKRLLVCHELARQQRSMHDARARRCDNRIVGLAQPHVRPIVRGIAGAHMEFGPTLVAIDKLDMNASEGVARVECVSFEAYHKGCIAIAACERYRERHGHYPTKVLVERAYLSRANRRYFRTYRIRYVVKPHRAPRRTR